MASKASSKKTMDVSKPGESAPNTSSRPVLVTHRPMVQDPMVKDDVKADDKVADSKASVMSHGDKVIQPVSDLSKPAEEAAGTPDQGQSSAAGSDPAKDDTTDDKPKTSTEATGTEAAVVDAVVDQATEDKKKQNQLSDEEKAKRAALQKLVEEKKYFVPIGQVGRRRNRRALLTVIVLVLLLVGGYAAVDAGFIDAGFDLPIDLIKN